MLIIFVDNQALDIYDQEINVTYNSIRFADAIEDQYTTDIEMPRTSSNDHILRSYGFIDGGFGFERSIPCMISLDDNPTDGFLQVTKFTDTTITATLYLSTLPYDMFDAEIRRVVDDVPSTIIPWDRATQNSFVTGFSNALKIDAYRYSANASGTITRIAQQHPSLRINDALARIGSSLSTPIGMPTVPPYVDENNISHDHRLLATDKCVCPSNNRQVLTDYVTSDGVYATTGGQHVVNDCNGYRIDDNPQRWIAFNRKCDAKITLYNKRQENAYTYVQVSNDGGNTWSNILTLNVLNEITKTGNYVFSDGELMRIYTTSPMTPYYTYDICVIDYSNYAIVDDDYGIELKYPENGAPTAMTYHTPPYIFDGSDPSLFGGLRLSYAYFGFFANLGEITIKELLNSLCWFVGKKLIYNGNAIMFTNADTKIDVSDGEMVEMSPVCDKLAKVNIIKWAETENRQIKFFIDNDFLHNERVIHGGKLYGTSHETIKEGTTHQYVVAYLPQYNIRAEVDTNNNVTYTASFNKISPALLMEVTTNKYGVTRHILVPPHQLSTFGVDSISGVRMVTFETPIYMRNYDYFFYDGHKYMIISVDSDIDTGMSTVTALLV